MFLMYRQVKTIVRTASPRKDNAMCEKLEQEQHATTEEHFTQRRKKKHKNMQRLEATGEILKIISVNHRRRRHRHQEY